MSWKIKVKRVVDVFLNDLMLDLSIGCGPLIYRMGWSYLIANMWRIGWMWWERIDETEIPGCQGQ